MIQLLFEKASQRVGIEIKGENVVFFDFSSMLKARMEGLKLNYEGVIKEHPDLKDNPEWQKITIDRLKEHIKKMNGEWERADYVIKELKKWQWKPLFMQREGFRPVKIS